MLNINDNAARFNREVYKVQVKENDPRQLLPFDLGLDPLIEITDPDLESGGGGRGAAMASGSANENAADSAIFNQLNPIDVHLSGLDADSFRLVKVAANVYRIEAMERFDYEMRTSYEFNVTAYDGVFKSEARVIVEVLDVNDNRPIFERFDYSFRIDENAPMQTEVGRVRATDLDATPENNLTLYKITSTFELSVFGINERTGIFKSVSKKIKSKNNKLQ